MDITPSEETITVSTATMPAFKPGEQVSFAEDETGHPITIIETPNPDRMIWPNCYIIDNPFSVFRMGFAPEEDLRPIEYVTVEDRDGLEALPIGTRYRDVEGDIIRKNEDGQWYLEGGRGYPWGPGLLSEFLPGVVLNPGILDFA